MQQPVMTVTPQPAPQYKSTPPPAPAPNTQALDTCNAQARQYQKVFAVDWPRELELSRGHTQQDDMRAGQKQTEYKAARREWDSIAERCSSVIGWTNTLSQETVELAMKQDCDARARGGYQIRSEWPQIAERLEITPNTKENRKAYLSQQNFNLENLITKCTTLVTGWRLGWDKDKLIAEAWKKENEADTWKAGAPWVPPTNERTRY
jgi:hypothetical protein